MKIRQGIIKYINVDISMDELKNILKSVFGDKFNVLEVYRMNRKIVDTEGTLRSTLLQDQ